MRGIFARPWLTLPRRSHHPTIRFTSSKPQALQSIRLNSTRPLRAPDLDEPRTIEHASWPTGEGNGHLNSRFINEILDNRYRIVHMLGSGTSSKVWLAYDCKACEYVAVKVGNKSADSQEGNILAELSWEAYATAFLYEDQPMITHMTDRFDLATSKGSQSCIVYDPALCSLREARSASASYTCQGGVFQLELARSLAAQLVTAFSFIHAKQYCHGNIHLGNLFLRMPTSVESLSIDELYGKFGSPAGYVFDETRGYPESCLSKSSPNDDISRLWLGMRSEDIPLGEAKLLVGGFGKAFEPSKHSRFESFTPLRYRPPEAQFEPDTPLTFSSDVWSLGCVIFELMGWGPLLDEVHITTPDILMAQLAHLQGPMPSEWWQRWEEGRKYFDEQQRPKTDLRDLWTWRDRKRRWIAETRQGENMEFMDEEEQAALLDLVRRMIAWRPEDRPIVNEVFDMPWMTKWALPSYEKAQRTEGEFWN